MKLVHLVKHLREYILHDTGGHRIEWKDITEDSDEVVMLRWSNEELTAYINEAIRQVYRRILPVHGYFPEFDIQVLAGQSDYVVDPRILRILSARLLTEDTNLCPVDLEQLDYKTNGRWRNHEGTPSNFMVDYTTGALRLYRTPEVDDTLSLLVNRLPLKEFNWRLKNDSAELREEFLIPMLDYAAFMAYSKDEPNTLDPGAADRRRISFEREFPFTSAYSDVRKRRSTRQCTRYGGL